MILLMKKLYVIVVLGLFLSVSAYAESTHFKCKPMKVFGQKEPSFDPQLSINLDNKTLSMYMATVPIHYVGERKIKAKDWYAEYEFDRILGHYTETILSKLPRDSYIKRWECKMTKPIF